MLWTEFVGYKCKGWSQKHNKPAVFLIVSYDKQYGFWLHNVADPDKDRICISERAIDRTFHVNYSSKESK